MSLARAVRRFGRIARILGPAGAAGFTIRWALRRDPIRVRVRGLGHPLLIRRFHPDITVLWQVFGVRECDAPVDRPPRFIIDGGGFTGLTAAYFAHAHPGAVIAAVEPDARNREMFARNAGSFSNVRLVPAALWNRSGHVRIVNPDALSWEFRVAECGAGDAGAMPAVTIPDLMRRFGFDEVDILKLDIEGSEEALFTTGQEEWLDRVRVIIVEVHGARCEDAVTGAMRGRGFTMSRTGEKLVFRRSPRLEPALPPVTVRGTTTVGVP